MTRSAALTGEVLDASTMLGCQIIDFVQFMMNVLHTIGWLGIIAVVLVIAYYAGYLLLGDYFEHKHMIQVRLDRYVGGR